MPRKKLTEKEKRKRKWDRRFKKAADKVRAKHRDKVLNEKWTYKASKNLLFKNLSASFHVFVYLVISPLGLVKETSSKLTLERKFFLLNIYFSSLSGSYI